MSEETMKRLKEIKAGTNYPSNVTITEIVDGKSIKIRFLLQSYIVGMYCAIHTPNDTIPHQSGDNNNRTFVTRLKKDIKKAIERGATVEIGSIVPVKTMD
jgi:hypothetical protein